MEAPNVGKVSKCARVDCSSSKKVASDRVNQTIRALPERVGYCINLLLISRHLERPADHATNIAEA